MSINNKVTSKNIASMAAKTLGNKSSSDIQKSLAASILSQSNKKR